MGLSSPMCALLLGTHTPPCPDSWPASQARSQLTPGQRLPQPRADPPSRRRCCAPCCRMLVDSVVQSACLRLVRKGTAPPDMLACLPEARRSWPSECTAGRGPTVGGLRVRV